MRINLVLQRLHAGVQQEPLLFLQFDLSAHAVEYLQLDSNHQCRGCVNRNLNPYITGALKTEDGTRKVSRQLRLHEAQSDDGSKEHDLPVKQARGWQIAPNQPVDAEIDERRERPDVVLAEVHPTHLPPNNTPPPIQ